MTHIIPDPKQHRCREIKNPFSYTLIPNGKAPAAQMECPSETKFKPLMFRHSQRGASGDQVCIDYSQREQAGSLSFLAQWADWEDKDLTRSSAMCTIFSAAEEGASCTFQRLWTSSYSDDRAGCSGTRSERADDSRQRLLMLLLHQTNIKLCCVLLKQTCTSQLLS